MNNKNEGIFHAAWIIAVVIIISKIAGFARDIVVANFYGVGLVSDAYFYAYQIPSLAVVILGGVGGPFHSATVAVFSKLITNCTDKPDKEARKLFNIFETFSLLIFLLGSFACFFFPVQIMKLIINGGSAELVNLAALHLKIMSPMLIIGAVIGIYYGILVTHKRFLLPNISPMMLSVVICIVLLFSQGDKTGIVLAIATTIGSLVQLIIQIPSVIKLGYGFMPDFHFRNNKHFNELLELLFPAFLSSTIGQLGVYVDMFFASSLREGAWTAFGYANRIFQFPVGLIMTAVLVPLFPLFSRLVAQKDTDGVRYYFNKGIISLTYIGVLIMVVFSLIGQDAIRLALQRGQFDHNATVLVAEILFIITLSIIPYALRDSATRLLYSYNDSKTPFLVAILCIILKIILNLILVKPLGINGIAISTTLVTLFNASMLAYLLRRKIKLGYKHYTVETLKMLFAGSIALVSGFIFAKTWSHYIPWSMLGGAFKISLITLICTSVYLLITILMKLESATDLMDKIRRKA